MLLPTIETKRLILRPFEIDDGPRLYKVVGADPEMTWDGTSRTIEEVTNTVLSRMRHFADHGFGVCATIERDTGELIGQTGLQILRNTTDVELVSYTVKRLWRRGYAEEGCLAALRYAFEILKVKRVLAVVRQDNIAAQKLSKKLGFRFLEDSIHYETSVKVSEMLPQEFTFPPSDHWQISFSEFSDTVPMA